MPRNGNSSRKRPAEESEEEEDKEPIDDDDEMMEEESDGEEEESGDEEMEEPEPEPLMGSPSPAKKDMKLRSGRRKRRRSKETTGLTPPEEEKASKKARPTTERKTKKTDTPSVVNGVDRTAAKSTGAAKPSARPPRASTRGRASLLSTDPEAVARAQDPEMVGSPLVPPAGDDSSRRLFDGKPPATASAAPSTETTTVMEVAPAHSEPQAPQEDAQAPQPMANGYHSVKEKMLSVKEKILCSPVLSSGIFWRICFMVLLAVPLYLTMWPLCVTLSEYIIPLKELTVPDDFIPAAISEPSREGESVVVEEDAVPLEPPPSLAQSIETLTRLRDRTSRRMEHFQKSRQKLRDVVDSLTLLLSEKKATLERSAHLNQAETLLRSVLDDKNGLDSAVWQQARESVDGLGRTILDTPSIELWQVEGPEGCAEPSASVGGESSSLPSVSNPAVLRSDLKKIVARLTERCMASTDNVKESQEAREIVRTWIKEQLDKSLEGNREAATTIANFVEAAKEAQSGDTEVEEQEQGLNVGDIEEIVEERLEMELADRTGEFDFASIYNGARIIRQGKWATSKSLVDSLPLGNRLLQLSQLQFYGFGPEAAISPTYPFNALGQCWSFQETPVAELLKRRRSQIANEGDDHKNGNFGTLSVSLPNLVRVESVIIEHPPKGITDQIDSAIRAFRVIGFEDAGATTRSWALGSFEYNISKCQYIGAHKMMEKLHGFDAISQFFFRISLFQNLRTLFKNSRSQLNYLAGLCLLYAPSVWLLTQTGDTITRAYTDYACTGRR